jgi:hypothetical protein
MVLRWLEGPVAATEQQREAVRKSILVEVGEFPAPSPKMIATLCGRRL